MAVAQPKLKQVSTFQQHMKEDVRKNEDVDNEDEEFADEEEKVEKRCIVPSMFSNTRPGMNNNSSELMNEVIGRRQIILNKSSMGGGASVMKNDAVMDQSNLRRPIEINTNLEPTPKF
jgi:hypothetical protein